MKAIPRSSPGRTRHRCNGIRSLGVINMTHALPKLPYDYSALEPHIDTQTMTIHHTKHHQTYVDKLNAALEGHADLQAKSLEDLLTSLATIPDAIRTAVRNHGGGHLNHSFFWPIMTPNGGGEAAGDIGEAINKNFGSFDKFKELFSQSAAGLFGSGWAWLVVNQGQLEIMTTPNQDNPISQHRIAVLGLDLWEHSYYLKYQNHRPEYITAWWNVVNWEKVNEHFRSAIR